MSVEWRECTVSKPSVFNCDSFLGPTGYGMLGQGITRATDTRQDMFADKGGTGMAGRVLAVFATVISPEAYLLPHGPRDGFTCHPRRFPSRFPP
jgi:hypothetical protein